VGCGFNDANDSVGSKKGQFHSGFQQHDCEELRDFGCVAAMKNTELALILLRCLAQRLSQRLVGQLPL
jgi:hypothetical protein